MVIYPSPSPPSPAQSAASLFHFIMGLYRRFLPRILIRIKIPPGSHHARGYQSHWSEAEDLGLSLPGLLN